jgi:hypothetical protein
MVLDPANYIIAKFKGTRGLAKAIDVDHAWISRWRKRGFIPAQHQITVLEAAKKQNIPLSPTEVIYGGWLPDKWLKTNYPWAIKLKSKA